MINSGEAYLTLIVVSVGVVVWLEKVCRFTLFKRIPAVVLLYLGMMCISSMGILRDTREIHHCYRMLKTTLLPFMIFLVMVRCDLRAILALGPRMILCFFTATAGIMLGFIVVYGIFKRLYEPDAWKVLAILSGSWIGGTGNMVALQEILKLPDSKMGYALLTDSVDYAIWVMVLLALIPLAPLFNRWTHADTFILEVVGEKVGEKQVPLTGLRWYGGFFLLILMGAVASALSLYLPLWFPTSCFLSPVFWTVLLATLLGSGVGFTPLSHIPGSSTLATVSLYLLIALIGSRAHFSGLVQAPVYITTGILVIAVHALVLLIAAKVWKLDLFTCGVASLANIGGIASAPILAAAYHESLLPVGVLLAMLGYLVGTGGGLIVGKLLSLL